MTSYTFNTHNRPPNRADDIVRELLPILIEQGEAAAASRYIEIRDGLAKFNRRGKQIDGITTMEFAVISGRLKNAIRENANG